MPFQKGVKRIPSCSFKSKKCTSSGSLRFKISLSKDEIEPELKSDTDVSKNVKLLTSKNLFEVLSELHTRFVKRDPKGIFAKPVTTEIAPDYFSVVSTPMDLGTIHSKLSSRMCYTDASQYMKDIRQMCTNAMIYNPPDTIYYQKARKMQAFAEKQMSTVSLQRICSDLNNHASLTPMELGQVGSSKPGETTSHIPWPLPTFTRNQSGICYTQSNTSLSPSLSNDSFHQSSCKTSTIPSYFNKRNKESTANLSPPSLVSAKPSPESTPSKFPPLLETADFSGLCSGNSGVLISEGYTQETSDEDVNVNVRQDSPNRAPNCPSPVSSSLHSKISIRPSQTELEVTSCTSVDSLSFSAASPSPSPRSSLSAFSDGMPFVNQSLRQNLKQSDKTSLVNKIDENTTMSSNVKVNSHLMDTSAKTMSSMRSVKPLDKLELSDSASKPLAIDSTRSVGRKTGSHRPSLMCPSKKTKTLKRSSKNCNSHLSSSSLSPLSKSSALNTPYSKAKSKRTYSEDIWSFTNSMTDLSPPDKVLAQIKEAADRARNKLLSKYAYDKSNDSIEAKPDSTEIGKSKQKIVYLETSKRGSVFAVNCPQAATREKGVSPVINDKLMPVIYPPALTKLLTNHSLKSEQKRDAGIGEIPNPVYNGLVEQMTSQEVASLYALSKLRYMVDEPIAGNIHGPLNIFNSKQLAELFDVYGCDPTTVEYALSMLTFAEPIGEWARRWVSQKLDVATLGLHSRMLSLFTQSPASENNWMQTAGLTIDPVVSESIINVQVSMPKNSINTASCLLTKTTNSMGSSFTAVAQLPTCTSTVSSIRQTATVQPLQIIEQNVHPRVDATITINQLPSVNASQLNSVDLQQVVILSPTYLSNEPIVSL